MTNCIVYTGVLFWSQVSAGSSRVVAHDLDARAPFGGLRAAGRARVLHRHAGLAAQVNIRYGSLYLNTETNKC